MADRPVGPNIPAILTDYGSNITCGTTRPFLMVFGVLCSIPPRVTKQTSPHCAPHSWYRGGQRGLAWQQGAAKGKRRTKALTRRGSHRPPLLPAKTEKELAVPMSRYHHNYFC